MTTENQQQPQQSQDINLESILRDPLSMPEGVDFETLAKEPTDDTPNVEENSAVKPDEQHAEQPKQGEKPSDAPGAEKDADAGEPEAGAAVASKNGKHIIPYKVLEEERERRARAEIISQELTAKVEALTNEIKTGQAAKTRDLSDIVDPQLLKDLREESPLVAQTIDKLMAKVQVLSEQAEQQSEVGKGDVVERQVQSIMRTEDAIAEIPKIQFLRHNDPDRYRELAEIDTLLAGKAAWKDKPLVERFEAALRMYESANGEIVLPGEQKKPAQQPTDEAKRVDEAVAKASAAAKGPSTLSDIPGGAPAASNDQDALAQLSPTALTKRFMDMTPEQVEAELARLS